MVRIRELASLQQKKASAVGYIHAVNANYMYYYFCSYNSLLDYRLAIAILIIGNLFLKYVPS